MANLVFVDNSGSTGGNTAYWTMVSSIIDASPADTEFFVWNDRCDSVFTKDFIGGRMIGGGTQPHVIVPHAPPNSNLTILTDGQVDPSDVVHCAKQLDGRPFAKVVGHFNGNEQHMNLSCIGPFLHKTKFELYRNGVKFSEGDTSQTLELKKYYDQPNAFLEDAPKIYSTLVAANFGRENKEMRHQLLSLQANLMKTVASSNNVGNSIQFDLLRDHLQKEDTKLATTTLATVLASSNADTGKQVAAWIDQMLRRCDLNSDFGFQHLDQPSRLVRAAVVPQVHEEKLEEAKTDGKFECPISMDSDVPCLAITEGTPVLDVDKGYLEAILTNPFLVLENAALVGAIHSRLDAEPIGAKAMVELWNTTKKSPFTRKTIVSFLPACDHSRKAANWRLANLFFGDKLVGNPLIWEWIVFLACTTKPSINSNKAFMDAFRETLMKRSRLEMTNITLSGLPIEPMIKAPLDIALWYVIHSGKEPAGERNRLRFFGRSAESIMTIVDLFKYPYDKEVCQKQIRLWRAFAAINNEDWSQLYSTVRAQWQKFITVGPRIFLDGPVDEKMKPKLPAALQACSLAEIWYLLQKRDPQKKTASIDIPWNLEVKELPPVTRNYGYDSKLQAQDYGWPVAISPKTMRPFRYVVVDGKKVPWEQAAAKHGPLDKQPSLHAYYVKFVHEHNRFPSEADLIEYAAARQLSRFGMDTLPEFTRQMVSAIFDDFAGAGVDKFTPAEFNQIVRDGTPLVRRPILDGSGD
jgi:hypothetical protein